MSDTITALATPPGISGIAVIRISGPSAFEITDKIFKTNKAASILEFKTHTIHYGNIEIDGELIDKATISLFKNPRSYTGEDVVEISCHGGMVVADKIIEALIENGARAAEPGEFTKRAFLNGALDLVQAEAVADIIHALSSKGAQTAAKQLAGGFTERFSAFRKQLLDIASLLELELDFSEEGLEFVGKDFIAGKIREALDFCTELADSYKAAQILRAGFYTSIAGFPNSGKSTLFNALLQRKRAIVSEIPGTTRDYLEETVILGNMPVRIIDTAGLRETEDIIEIEGIKLAESVLEQSNMIIVLNDITVSKKQSDGLYKLLKSKYFEARVILVHNKIDAAEVQKEYDNSDILYISAKTGEGIAELKKEIERSAKASVTRIQDALINERQANILKEAAENLNHALNSLKEGAENEFIAFDIRKAGSKLGEITGESWDEEILNNIFGKFCIGK